MIAEQDTFFMCLSRFRDSTDFDRIRSIGVRSWIGELDNLTHPIDHKTVSIAESIANYMVAQGDPTAAELLRSNMKPVIDGLQAFWETALQQCEDQAAFAEATKYENDSLGKQYWHFEFTLNAISDMVSKYRSGTADGESTYQSAFEYLKLSKSETSTFKRPQKDTPVPLEDLTREQKAQFVFELASSDQSISWPSMLKRYGLDGKNEKEMKANENIVRRLAKTDDEKAKIKRNFKGRTSEE